MDYINSSVANTYSRFPLHFVEAKGCYLKDVEGKEFLDFTSDIAVCSLGHCNDRVNEAVKKQVGPLLHDSNLYWTDRPWEIASQVLKYKFFHFFGHSSTKIVMVMRTEVVHDIMDDGVGWMHAGMC